MILEEKITDHFYCFYIYSFVLFYIFIYVFYDQEKSKQVTMGQYHLYVEGSTVFSLL